MTTTERTTALGGDEAAEQRSAPNLDAGVVGDLGTHLRRIRDMSRAIRRFGKGFGYGDLDVAMLDAASLDAVHDALAKYATPGTGEAGPVEIRSCSDCGFIGLTEEADPDVDVCASCGDTGARSDPDKCSGCGATGTMCIACPKCQGRFALERTVSATQGTGGGRPTREDLCRDAKAALDRLIDWCDFNEVQWDACADEGVPEGAETWTINAKAAKALLEDDAPRFAATHQPAISTDTREPKP